MASIILAEDVDELDITSFSKHVHDQLPSYARPVFLRIQREMDTTGTFKMVKGDLRKEGYSLEAVSDPLYVLKPKSSTYEVLAPDFAAKILSGDAGY